MPFVFSPSMVAFYDEGNRAAYLAAGTWPSDAVPVSDGAVASFMGNPPEGYILGADGNGQPAWVPRPPDPPPSRAETVTAAVAAGMTLQSASQPGINHTWALDDLTQREIQGLALAVATGIGFPNGQPAFAYPDKNGEMVIITEASIVVLYKAMVAYVLALRAYQGGATDEPPPNPFSFI